MVKKLDTRIIILSFIALWLFENAGGMLGFLTNPALAEQIRRTKGNATALNDLELTLNSIMDLQIASAFGSLIGLLIGLLFSLNICRKRKWHWLNPILAFLLVYLSGWLLADRLNFADQMLRMPGQPFNGVWYYLVNGIVSVALGLFIFGMINLIKHSDKNRLETQASQTV